MKKKFYVKVSIYNSLNLNWKMNQMIFHSSFMSSLSAYDIFCELQSLSKFKYYSLTIFYMYPMI